VSRAYRSRLPAVLGALARATDAGLTAAASVLQARVKRDLAAGYTSGDFVTGNVLNSVTVSPITQEGPLRVIRVGTNAKRNGVSYPLAWELGHLNTFTRRFERKEVWVPALVAERATMARAFRQAATLSLRAR
jgi:hypothetical protein